MSNIAIKAENISKYYRLGQINNGTLYADIQSWFARKFGKEDPHAKIGFNSAQSDKDGFWALKDINFEIKQGDRVGIIGRNGAGKSTLLKVISEITTPTTGNIYIKGRVASLLEVGTGFHPEMTGRENIYMNGAILGMKRAEITRQLDEIIDFAEIEKYIDTPVKRYSSGMYVRLAFAVAAHLQSEILIADEVLAVGDAAFQKKAIGKMNDLSTGEGRTVLFVSHNMDAVKNLCNTGIILEKGILKTQSDNINELIDCYLNYKKDYHNNELWENDGSIGNQYFYPIRMELLKKLNNNEHYSVHIEFKIDKLMSNLYYRFYLYEYTTGICICSFSPFHSISEYHPHIGINRLSFVLPQNFFLNKRYRLELCATLYHSEYILKRNENAPNLVFNITKRNGYDPFSRDDVSHELLAPIVAWNVEK